ncbi:type II toxin-antitoxin system VapC family toxin [Bisgaard Taxon 10/6]|uniref:type II toxin-antitoxin system VapC family toxin n=1 Tax=Exercitatus varius TaxID=67857 RepID=UPI00294AA638|nr:type II toxin-antitoxin system VapC family toxin [Exercitatus varius]MDG2953771.1 type II toxin-antitoxin system VapC family toxin [Exercitatus varius]
MYLLDTNIVSELRKMEKHQADPNVTKWFEQINLNDAYLSVVTLFEIKVGILQLQRKDIQQAAILQNWFETRLLPLFEHRILPLSSQIMLACAEFHIPNKKPLNDAYLAATAKVHRFKMVTRNTKDFEKLKLDLINPFGQKKARY